MTTPRTARPANQPMATGRSNRIASVVGPASRAVEDSGASLPPNSPAPTSRRPAMATAAPDAATTTTTTGTKASGLDPVSGRSPRTTQAGWPSAATPDRNWNRPPYGSGTTLRARRRRSRWPTGGWRPARRSKAPTERNIAAPATSETARNSDPLTEKRTVDIEPSTTTTRAVISHSAPNPASSPTTACVAARRRVVWPTR